ncbi:alpha/beta fold hydrolase [candidate division KSB1 bacterium]|nr:alpha/beta fold hydrolase [candidate division KSB1 bacterium]NIR71185.1 alpha/beta fold hydrolase [candidate division KSB1 bacterium]NIS26170.1 alpha/beta fold hydrolase [candidate division KSB1 bacterium]NIT72935.1 alpha/beta fold hydrolase [candidate division KSB1 bacterium]NIU26817.1 alpha/beta fold hydrolase [candidate division KSB1 bacterium]
MKLYHREYGHGQTKLVILHGILGSSRNWHTVAGELSQHFHVIVPDLRNHGRSPHTKHSIQLMQADVLELLDRLELKPTFLLGHSMGGLVAMKFAFHHPKRLNALIVEDIAPVAFLNTMDDVFDAMKSVELAKVKRREDADDQLLERVKEPSVRQFLLQNLKRQKDGTYDWQCNLPELHRFVQAEERFEPAANEKFTGPTLFVGGERSEHRIDEHQNVISRHLPNSERRTIANAGHWVHVDAIDEFVQTVTGFVKKISESHGDA